MVEDGAFSHKIDDVPIFEEHLNLKGHLNCCTGSKVTAILVNGGILPRGGVASGRVCPAACTAGLFVIREERKAVKTHNLLLISLEQSTMVNSFSY